MNLSIGALVVLILAVIVVIFASKIIAKLLGFVLACLAVVGVMYYFSWGPFEQKGVDVWSLDQKYCLKEVDHDICECIIEPIHDDIHSRFNEAEIEQIKSDKVRSLYIFKKSMDVTKEQSMLCLAERDAEDKYKTFVQDLIPVNNETLDKVGAQTKKWWERLKKEVADFQKDKEEIDDKY